eukprot:3935428-Rhodomonas_salina.1
METDGRGVEKLRAHPKGKTAERSAEAGPRVVSSGKRVGTEGKSVQQKELEFNFAVAVDVGVWRGPGSRMTGVSAKYSKKHAQHYNGNYTQQDTHPTWARRSLSSTPARTAPVHTMDQECNPLL